MESKIARFASFNAEATARCGVRLRISSVAVAAFALVWVGCGQATPQGSGGEVDQGTPGAGDDAGSVVAPADSGTDPVADAGPTGNPDDAGTGVVADAGTEPPADAGTEPPADAGVEPDAGTGEHVGALDTEGIAKLYADNPAQAAQQWFLSQNGPVDSGDRRIVVKGTARNIGGGVFQFSPTTSMNPPSARLYIGTTNPDWNNQSLQVARGADWRNLIRNGYMIGPEDYRDAEVTAYFKITQSSGDDQMTFYWRGGQHPSGIGYPTQCIAVCMKAEIETRDCSPRAAKEYDHYNSPDSYAWNDTVAPAFDLKAALGGTMVGKLVGQKLVMYDIKDSAGNVTAVKMELWVDTGSKDLAAPDPARQNWRLLGEYTDNGTNWPDPRQETYIAACHASKGQLIAWGGPSISLRLDNNVWNLYKLSVRPILPRKLQ